MTGNTPTPDDLGIESKSPHAPDDSPELSRLGRFLAVAYLVGAFAVFFGAAIHYEPLTAIAIFAAYVFVPPHALKIYWGNQ